MEFSTFVTIILATLALVGSLGYIIYQNLENKTKENASKIDCMTLKDDFEKYKEEHNREHDKQDKAFDKLDGKLDKIISMLLERNKNEK